jgi:hypothetical protein
MRFRTEHVRAQEQRVQAAGSRPRLRRGDQRAADAAAARPRVHHQADDLDPLACLDHQPVFQTDEAVKTAALVLANQHRMRGQRQQPAQPHCEDRGLGRIAQLCRQARDLRSVVDGGVANGRHERVFARVAVGRFRKPGVSALPAASVPHPGRNTSARRPRPRA